MEATVRKGRWLYAGTVESEVRIVRRAERFFDDGDAGTVPPFFYIEWHVPGAAGEVGSIVGAFPSVEAAVAHAESVTAKAIHWEP